jgi:hypothetical protein
MTDLERFKQRLEKIEEVRAALAWCQENGDEESAESLKWVIEFMQSHIMMGIRGNIYD